MESIKDIKHAFYINLDSRTDRKLHIENQLKIMNIHAERFNAIKLKNGAIGCSMSHLKCLEIAKKNNWDHIMIIEDDILFLNPELFKNQLNKFFKNNKDFDVILIAGNNVPPYQKIDDSCVKVYRCQTTTGYIVQKHYYDKLIDNFKDGLQRLIREPHNKKIYSLIYNKII
jgi:glycosyl transferase family 25